MRPWDQCAVVQPQPLRQIRVGVHDSCLKICTLTLELPILHNFGGQKVVTLPDLTRMLAGTNLDGSILIFMTQAKRARALLHLCKI